MSDTTRTVTAHEAHLPELDSRLVLEGRCTRMDLRPWFNLLRAAATREEGQTMAEYGVVLALITLVVVGIIATLGSTIYNKISGVVSSMGG